MTTALWIILAAIALYMIIMLAIGFKSAQKNKSSSDFFLGGRKLGPFVTAMSAEASDMSGWLLMGLPGAVYAMGTGQAWIAIGLLAVFFLLGYLLLGKADKIPKTNV